MRIAIASSAAQGLSTTEASERLQRDGHNELPRPDQRTFFRIVFEVLREPMLALLAGGGIVYFLLGELRDALILLAFGFMSILITVVQEARTEKVLEALRDLTSPRALVIRDGKRIRIPGRDVVQGDFIVLAEGDRVPADAILIEAHDLQTDESLLTGESVPVHKIAGHVDGQSKTFRPGGDDMPCVFSGALVVRGNAIGEVIATGVRSEIGKIGHQLSILEIEPPRLQAQTRKLVKVFALVGGAVSILIVFLYGTLRGGWLHAVLAGIALGMSMLPEEFPVVLAVFMAMGAWRISQARVLTRRTSAIETLGSATVLCTDKTGTLTENRMTIAELHLPKFNAIWSRNAANTKMPKAFFELVVNGLRASAETPFDPMDKAFHELRKEQFGETKEKGAVLHGYGLRPDLLAFTQVWNSNSKNKHLVATKGAPEAIAGLCKMNVKERKAISKAVEEVASRGLRVLGVAQAIYSGQKWPSTPRGFAFKFIGLVGIADPLRISVPVAVQQCRTAGIRVIMITGDYPATAQGKQD